MIILNTQCSDFKNMQNMETIDVSAVKSIVYLDNKVNNSDFYFCYLFVEGGRYYLSKCFSQVLLNCEDSDTEINYDSFCLEVLRVFRMYKVDVNDVETIQQINKNLYENEGKYFFTCKYNYEGIDYLIDTKYVTPDINEKFDDYVEKIKRHNIMKKTVINKLGEYLQYFNDLNAVVDEMIKQRCTIEAWIIDKSRTLKKVNFAYPCKITKDYNIATVSESEFKNNLTDCLKNFYIAWYDFKVKPDELYLFTYDYEYEGKKQLNMDYTIPEQTTVFMSGIHERSFLDLINKDLHDEHVKKVKEYNAIVTDIYKTIISVNYKDEIPMPKLMDESDEQINYVVGYVKN